MRLRYRSGVTRIDSGRIIRLATATTQDYLIGKPIMTEMSCSLEATLPDLRSIPYAIQLDMCKLHKVEPRRGSLNIRSNTDRLLAIEPMLESRSMQDLVVRLSR